MIPIAKNITVLDGSGRTLEPTYEKRARGLVKHGRARWENEYTITLTCPPFDDMKEDTQMSDTVYTASTAAATPSYEYIMAKIDEIMADTAHLAKAAELLGDFEINTSLNGGFGDQSRAEAIKATILARETTSQEILKILNRMLDGLQPERPVDHKVLELELELKQIKIKAFTDMMEAFRDSMDLEEPESLRIFMEKAQNIIGMH